MGPAHETSGLGIVADEAAHKEVRIMLAIKCGAKDKIANLPAADHALRNLPKPLSESNVSSSGGVHLRWSGAIAINSRKLPSAAS